MGYSGQQVHFKLVFLCLCRLCRHLRNYVLGVSMILSDMLSQRYRSVDAKSATSMHRCIYGQHENTPPACTFLMLWVEAEQNIGKIMIYHQHFAYCYHFSRPHRTHEMQTVVFNDSIMWVSVSLPVCHTAGCCYSFTRWRHFDAAITLLL